MPAPDLIQRQERRSHLRRETRRPLTADDRTGRDDFPPVIPTGSNRPVSETLPPAIQRIVQTLDPEKIVLFGSYAYDAPTPDSDVDLYVLPPYKYSSNWSDQSGGPSNARASATSLCVYNK